MTKRAKALQQVYLEQEPTNEYLTDREVLQRFPELAGRITPGQTFMWNNIIITVKLNNIPKKSEL